MFTNWWIRNTFRGFMIISGEFPLFEFLNWSKSWGLLSERMMVKAGYWLKILATFSMMEAECSKSLSSRIRKWHLLNAVLGLVGVFAFLSSCRVGKFRDRLKHWYYNDKSSDKTKPTLNVHHIQLQCRLLRSPVWTETATCRSFPPSSSSPPG